MRQKNALLSLVGMALLAPAVALGQITTALLEGRVLGEGGAVLSSATVEAHNLDTGLKRTGTPDQDGSYRIRALPVGPYEVTASAAGFASEVRSGVTLRVGQQATVDFSLTVAAADTITVTAEPLIVEVTESAIGTTITTEQIDDLPLAGRTFTELAALTPGIQNSVTEGSEISASGGSGSSNTYLVDGVSLDREGLGGQRGTFSPDVIREFEVLSSQYPAEFGRASGAAINVVTRSGANDLRGRLSGYYRADDLAEDNPFVASNLKTPFTQTIYSGFLGGPIRRDKMFYFAGYERTDLDNTAVITVDPAVLAALGLDPNTTVPTPFVQDRVLAKVDFAPVPNQYLTLRYDFEKSEQDNFAVGGIVAREFTGANAIENKNAILSHTWIFDPKVVNDLRLQYSTAENDLTKVNCPGCPTIQRPSVVHGKFFGLPQKATEERLQLVESLSFELRDKLGDHYFKTGLDFSRIEFPLEISQFHDGLFFFTTDRPFNPNDRSTYPIIYQQGVGDRNITIHDRIYGAFFQDQWRVTPGFTLNLGVRWDYEDHAAIKHDKDNFAPRLHFAWDPFLNGKTVVRGGYGVYYDPIFLNVVGIGQFFAPGRFRVDVIFAPGFPDPRVGGIPLPPQPPNVSVLPTDTETPHSNIASLGFAREIGRDLALSVDAVRVRGHNLLLFVDDNAPVGGRRPDPAFSQKQAVRTSGRSEYEALQLGLRKRFGGRYSLNVAYTLAENKNNTDSHRGFVTDSRNPEIDFGSSLNDVRHTLNLATTVEGPWGVKLGLGGTYRSGAPYNITTGLDNNGDGNPNDRPPGVKRNSGRAPEVWTVNLRLAKVFSVKGVELELIAETFNLFDETNETGFIGNMLSPSFGQPTGVLGGAFGPRQTQLGVRIDF